MIKAQQILESISQVLRLDERNVANIPELEKYIDAICRDTTNRDIQNWFQKRYLYYLKEVCPYVTPVTSVDSGSPPWLQQALDRGDEVVVVEIDGFFEEMEEILNLLRDFSELAEIDPDFKRSFDKILKTPMSQDLLERLRDISQNLAKAGIELVPGIVTQGYKWFKLKSWKAIKEEGDTLGLCLKNLTDEYFKNVTAGNTILYSMRKNVSDPKVTMEVRRDGQIVQIKGLHDKPPQGNYIFPCIEFINYGLKKGWFTQTGWDRGGLPEDLDTMGAVFYRNYLYHESELPSPLLKSNLEFVMRDGNSEWRSLQGYDLTLLFRRIIGKYLNSFNYEDTFFLLFDGDEPILFIRFSYYTKKVESVLDLQGRKIEGKFLEPCVNFLNYANERGLINLSSTPSDLYEYCILGDDNCLYLKGEASKAVVWKKRIYEIVDLLSRRQLTNSLLDEIEDYMKGGANPNEAEHLLMRVAINENIIEIVRLLLRYDIDINKSYNRGELLLYSAVRKNREEIVRLFLEHGADPNLREAQSQVALIDIAGGYDRSESLFKMLLDYGANPNDGDPPTICSVASWGSLEKLKILLEKGVDPNVMCWGKPIAQNIREGNNNKKEQRIALLKEYGLKDD
jgi:hypothetical protein